MHDILLLGLLGVGIGGFYGLLAIGVVVGHKGSGLINLDQGALAMYPAYTFVTMRESGEVFLPWFDVIPGPIDIPYRIQVAGRGLGVAPSLLAALAMSVLLGVLVQTLVFGPLRNKPAISKVIGSLGALLYLTSVALFQFGAKARQVDGLLPTGEWVDPFGLGGQVPYERLALAAIALAAGAGLSQYYRRTRIGLTTRAAEDSEMGTALLGYSVNRIATTNWLISTTVTGIGGVLALSFVSLTPTRYTLFVVPALGAALIGNLTSPWLAGVGGVLLGMFQSAAAGLTLTDWWPVGIPADGMRQVVPLVLIVAFQFFRGQTIPFRSNRLEERQPSLPRPTNWQLQIVVVALATVWFLWTASRVTEGKLVTTLIAAILMLSSVVLIGYLGQISLAGLAFAGVAAYLATKFAADGSRYGASPFVVDGPGLADPLAVLVGVSIAVGVGLLLAIPALRIRGVQLAVVTLAAAVAAAALLLGNEWLLGPGARSNVTVPPAKWFGVDVGVTFDESGLASRTTLAIFCLLWLLVVIAAVSGLRMGATGRQFLAVRANERAAESVGVNVVGVKLLGFAISSAIAGIAGALTAYHQTVLQVSSYSALAGINNVALLFLGGVGRIPGALLGAALTPGGVLSSTSGGGNFLRGAVSGALLIAVAVFRSDGLVSLGDTIKHLPKRTVPHPKVRDH